MAMAFSTTAPEKLQNDLEPCTQREALKKTNRCKSVKFAKHKLVVKRNALSSSQRYAVKTSRGDSEKPWTPAQSKSIILIIWTGSFFQKMIEQERCEQHHKTPKPVMATMQRSQLDCLAIFMFRPVSHVVKSLPAWKSAQNAAAKTRTCMEFPARQPMA